MTDYYESEDGELPISGGWGYSKEDAVVIDKEDPVVSKGMPFDGVGIEYIFVENRISEELIILENANSEYYGIEWKIIEQRLIFDDDRKYDILLYEVTAIQESGWDTQKWEWGGNADNQGLELMDHIERKNKKKICYSTECWFDITSFYGTD